MELSVVVPVYNERENVVPLLDETAEALSGLEYEILFVDDGSSDGTAERLREEQAKRPALRVLRHRIRCGQSTAIHTGVKHARAPWVATLDGDCQNSPADIPRLLALALDSTGRQEAPVTCVCGCRMKRRDNWIRRVSSRIANGVRSRLLGDEVPDSGCGIKIFSREAFLELPYFDHMHRFLPALFKRAGKRVVSTEVAHRPRARGCSKYGIMNRLFVGMVDLWGVWWLQRRARVPQVTEE